MNFNSKIHIHYIVAIIIYEFDKAREQYLVEISYCEEDPQSK